jgi:hypothetical protein
MMKQDVKKPICWPIGRLMGYFFSLLGVKQSAWAI